MVFTSYAAISIIPIGMPVLSSGCNSPRWPAPAPVWDGRRWTSAVRRSGHRAVDHRGVFFAARAFDQKRFTRDITSSIRTSFGGEHESALQQSGQQRGAHAFARDVHDDARIHVGADRRTSK
jgi:hypothetical protein